MPFCLWFFLTLVALSTCGPCSNRGNLIQDGDFEASPTIFHTSWDQLSGSPTTPALYNDSGTHGYVAQFFNPSTNVASVPSIDQYVVFGCPASGTKYNFAFDLLLNGITHPNAVAVKFTQGVPNSGDSINVTSSSMKAIPCYDGWTSYQTTITPTSDINIYIEVSLPFQSATTAATGRGGPNVLVDNVYLGLNSPPYTCYPPSLCVAPAHPYTITTRYAGENIDAVACYTTPPASCNNCTETIIFNKAEQ